MNEWEWQLLEDKSSVDAVEIDGAVVRRGSRVKLHPRARGDVFDIALNGKTATIESIEQDYEGNLHVGVVLDDDPGRDIGLMRQPGHRFFFAVEEVKPVAQDEAAPRIAPKKLLIAGIGNIFLGDDGFGVEVAARLARQQLPAGVRVADFGIRGLDLAYALLEGYETTVLIDAFPGEGQPGSVFLVQPDLRDASLSNGSQSFLDAHAMNPLTVLRMAKSMGAELKRILLVGCVPETLGPEQGQMGLSTTVAEAVSEAVKLVDSLVTRILAGDWPAKT
jgi:hydrogenase maturation protease